MSEEQNKVSPPLTDDNQQQGPPLNNPSTDEPIVPAEETSEIINPPSENQDMEVHHHAHDPAAPHHKKSWKSYFWEFLILFLAVFCGFLAEYQLEHVIEHQREKQYIKSMVDDLQTNSVHIERLINLNKQQVEGFDSLLQNIYHTPYTDSSIRTLYYLKERYTLFLYRVNFSKGTISQLKNSGGLRLIRKRAVVDSIYSYEYLSDRIERQGDGIELSDEKLLEVSVKCFDGELVLGLDQSNLILTSNKKFKLLTTDEKIIKEYANLAKYKKDVVGNYIRQLTNLQNRIPGIIQFLEKEYDLK